MITVGTLQAVLTTDLTAFRSGLTQARRELSEFGKVSIPVAGVQSLANQLNKLGAEMTALAVPITGAFLGGVKAAADFESTLKEIEVRAGATASELEEVKNVSLEMSKTTLFSASEASQGLLELLVSGNSLRTSIAMLKPVLDLAVVGNLQLGESADVVTNILKQFNLESEDAARATENAALVAQLLSAGASASSADVGDLTAAMVNVGDAAFVAGQDLQTTIAALAELADSGSKGATAGTRLKSMFRFLLRDKAQLKLKELGVNMFYTNKEVEKLIRLNNQLDDQGNPILKYIPKPGDFKDLDTILKDINKAMSGMTEEERAKTIMELGGSYGQLALSALLGSEGLSSMLDKMRQTPPVAELVGSKAETLAGKLDLLKNNVIALSVNALQPFIENTLKPLIEAFTTAVQKANDWVKEHPDLANRLVNISFGFLVLGPALFFAGRAAETLALALKTLTSPLGLFLAGAVLLNGETLKANFTKIGEGLNTLGGALVNFASGETNYETLLSGLAGGIKRIVEAGAGLGQDIIQNIRNLLSSIQLPEGIKETAISVLDKLSGVLQKFAALDWEALLRIGSSAGMLFLTIAGELAKIKLIGFELLISFLNSLTDFFEKISSGDIGGALQSAAGGLLAFAGAMLILNTSGTASTLKTIADQISAVASASPALGRGLKIAGAAFAAGVALEIGTELGVQFGNFIQQHPEIFGVNLDVTGENQFTAADLQVTLARIGNIVDRISTEIGKAFRLFIAELVVELELSWLSLEIKLQTFIGLFSTAIEKLLKKLGINIPGPSTTEDPEERKGKAVKGFEDYLKIALISAIRGSSVGEGILEKGKKDPLYTPSKMDQLFKQFMQESGNRIVGNLTEQIGEFNYSAEIGDEQKNELISKTQAIFQKLARTAIGNFIAGLEVDERTLGLADELSKDNPGIKHPLSGEGQALIDPAKLAANYQTHIPLILAEINKVTSVWRDETNPALQKHSDLLGKQLPTDYTGLSDAATEALRKINPELSNSAVKLGDLESKVGKVSSAFSSLGPTMVAPFRSWVKNVGAILQAAGKYVPGLASIGAGLIAASEVKPMQKGGPFRAGDTMLVGERGPELVRFNRSGVVMSAAQTAGFMAGRGDKPIVVQMVVDRKVLYETILSARRERNYRDF